MVVAVVAVIRFERSCSEDLADTPDFELRFLTRLGWTAFILLSISIGGVCYLYCRKSR